jgi:nitrous oxide reductase accessory protein NosL
VIARAAHRSPARCFARLWLLLAAACSQPTSGPLSIAWGREPCAHCSMAIGEARFAAEVRLGPHELLRYDDFGCAIVWLEEHADSAEALEIWVMDQDREEWLDARAAFYRTGQRTHMSWGFGGISAREPGALDFETARQDVLARARERASRGGS